jgi:hypothetical protein
MIMLFGKGNYLCPLAETTIPGATFPESTQQNNPLRPPPPAELSQVAVVVAACAVKYVSAPKSRGADITKAVMMI